MESSWNVALNMYTESRRKCHENPHIDSDGWCLRRIGLAGISAGRTTTRFIGTTGRAKF